MTATGGLAMFTTPAQASPPLVVTDAAHATGATTAIVEGNGDPEGQSTTLHAEYALASEQWCSSGGTEGTPRETAQQDLGSGHVMFSEVLVKLEGLLPASEYCAELVATNASGTTYGSQVRFTTTAQASPPVVATDGVQVLSTTTTRVSGNADPEGQSTTLHADYARASQTWCVSAGKEGTPVETVPATIGSLNAMISELAVDLEGLTPGTEYCTELVAQNASGTAFGGLVTFTTPAPASPSPVVTEGTESPLPVTLPIVPIATPALSSTSKPLTRVQKLARALKLCSSKPKKQRAACIRNARRKYGTSKKTAEQTSRGKR
jgi:hypothetical protein